MIKPVILIMVAIFLSGCSLLSHQNQISTLKSFSESQASITSDVRIQKDNFLKLKSDIQNNLLKANTSKKYIFNKYGKPVYCKEEACVYRLPGNELSIELIYLYFSQKGRLNSWKII